MAAKKKASSKTTPSVKPAAPKKSAPKTLTDRVNAQSAKVDEMGEELAAEKGKLKKLLAEMKGTPEVVVPFNTLFKAHLSTEAALRE